MTFRTAAFFLWVTLAGLFGCATGRDLAEPVMSPPAMRAAQAASEAPANDDRAGAATGSPQPVQQAGQPGPQKAPPAPTAPPPAPPPGQGAHRADLLVYTATLVMAVYQVEPNLDAVERAARDTGGYLAQRGDRQITIRVPRARFEDALHKVETIGDVIHRDVVAEDVTDQYVELETRLRNARVMRDRLEQLLARAGVKEAIEIEKELGRVTGEIESMEGKLKLLKDRIAFSTITVSFEPRGAGAVRDVPLRLPFPWLSTLGLPRLLSLSEGGAP